MQIPGSEQSLQPTSLCESGCLHKPWVWVWLPDFFSKETLYPGWVTKGWKLPLQLGSLSCTSAITQGITWQCWPIRPGRGGETGKQRQETSAELKPEQHVLRHTSKPASNSLPETQGVRKSLLSCAHEVQWCLLHSMILAVVNCPITITNLCCDI